MKFPFYSSFAFSSVVLTKTFEICLQDSSEMGKLKFKRLLQVNKKMKNTESQPKVKREILGEICSLNIWISGIKHSYNLTEHTTVWYFV